VAGVVALFLPAPKHELNLEVDGTSVIADIAPNIFAYGTLRIRGQRYENLTGRSPASTRTRRATPSRSCVSGRRSGCKSNKETDPAD
jgi:hypothetical protein